MTLAFPNISKNGWSWWFCFKYLSYSSLHMYEKTPFFFFADMLIWIVSQILLFVYMAYISCSRHFSRIEVWVCYGLASPVPMARHRTTVSDKYDLPLGLYNLYICFFNMVSPPNQATKLSVFWNFHSLTSRPSRSEFYDRTTCNSLFQFFCCYFHDRY